MYYEINLVVPHLILLNRCALTYINPQPVYTFYINSPCLISFYTFKHVMISEATMKNLILSLTLSAWCVVMALLVPVIVVEGKLSASDAALPPALVGHQGNHVVNRQLFDPDYSRKGKST